LDAPLKIRAHPSWYACSVPKMRTKVCGVNKNKHFGEASRNHSQKAKTENLNTDPSQTTFGNYGKLRRICMMNDENKAEILPSMVYFVANNKQAFSVVESSSFSKFCKTTNKNFELPSRNLYEHYTTITQRVY
jgi:hypothetical protein